MKIRVVLEDSRLAAKMLALKLADIVVVWWAKDRLDFGETMALVSVATEEIAEVLVEELGWESLVPNKYRGWLTLYRTREYPVLFVTGLSQREVIGLIKAALDVEE